MDSKNKESLTWKEFEERIDNLFDTISELIKDTTTKKSKDDITNDR